MVSKWSFVITKYPISSLIEYTVLSIKIDRIENFFSANLSISSSVFTLIGVLLRYGKKEKKSRLFESPHCLRSTDKLRLL